MVMAVPLDRIRLDGNTQCRLTLDNETIVHYAECLSRWNLPPGKAVEDSERNLWLWEGFHTWHAHQKADRLLMTIEVT